jgi:hypothetical protein
MTILLSAWLAVGVSDLAQAGTGSGAAFTFNNSFTVIAVTTTNVGGGYTALPSVSLPTGSGVGLVAGPVLSLATNGYAGGNASRAPPERSR